MAARKTKTDILIEAFSEAAQQVGVEVRTERLIGIGGVPVTPGLAKVDDNWVIFLEKRQPARHRLDALLDALSPFDLNDTDLPEEARSLLLRASLR